MKREELRESIGKMMLDVEFSYNGVDGSVCPISENEIGIMYDEQEDTVRSVDELMSTPFIDGKTLNEVCEELDIY